GWTDSMDFAQLGGLLAGAGAGIRSLADVPNLATLQRLQSEIVTGDLGVQNIRSDYFVSPFGPEQAQLPRSFLVFGQKFVPDSFHRPFTTAFFGSRTGKRTKFNVACRARWMPRSLY